MDEQISIMKEVLSVEDLAAVLGISVWSVYAKTSKRNRDHVKLDLPPFFYIGKFVRFSKDDVLAWIAKQKRVNA
jgi:predicted DNA-binding transcriptional regulator AlpA